ncbi:hypothetical protein Tco_0551596 [Tanacetum coccineum]
MASIDKALMEHAEFDESNANVLERFYTSAGNPVKEILLKLNLPDHRKLKDGGEVKEFQRSFCHSDTERLSRSGEVLKVKEFQERCNIKAFQVNKSRKTVETSSQILVTTSKLSRDDVRINIDDVKLTEEDSRVDDVTNNK